MQCNTGSFTDLGLLYEPCSVLRLFCFCKRDVFDQPRSCGTSLENKLLQNSHCLFLVKQRLQVEYKYLVWDVERSMWSIVTLPLFMLMYRGFRIRDCCAIYYMFTKKDYGAQYWLTSWFGSSIWWCHRILTTCTLFSFYVFITDNVRYYRNYVQWKLPYTPTPLVWCHSTTYFSSCKTRRNSEHMRNLPFHSR